MCDSSKLDKKIQLETGWEFAIADNQASFDPVQILHEF